MPLLTHPICMADRGLAAVLARHAQGGHPFLLSEVIADAGGKNSIRDAATELWPHFTDLGLVPEKIPGDLCLRPRDPPVARVLTRDERTRLEACFRNPGLPGWISDGIMAYIQKKTGKRWDDPSVLRKIRRAILNQKDEYWKEGSRKRITYQKGYSVLGYLAYQAPVYFLQAEHIMFDLALSGLLRKSMRILDAGTGPGVIPLAFADFLGRIGGCTADIYSVEKSEEFTEAFRYLAGTQCPGDGPVTIHPPIQADLAAIRIEDLPPSLDLIVFQNVLNEMTGLTMQEKGMLVREFSGALSPDGSMVLAEPADMVNSVDLRRIAYQASGKGLSIHAPCRFLWGSPCNPDRCWSFVQKPSIRPTLLMEALGSMEDGYRYRNTDIKYSYALLRKGTPPRYPGTPLSPREYARLATLGRHVNRRINVAAAVMSGNLGDHRTYVYRICDGTTRQPVYAVLPAYHRSGGNAALLSMAYGNVAAFKSVLVRFNQKYRAYNLLVSRESRVCPMSGPATGLKEAGMDE